ALLITNALFTGNVQDLSAKQIAEGFKNMPQFMAPREAKNLAIWLVDLGLIASRRQAREFVQNGAISINGEKIADLDFEISPEHAIGDQYIIVRRGKKNYYLVTFED